MPTDVGALGVDFFGVTGHKMLGPTGIGVPCWAAPSYAESMPPFLCGGEMIRDVRLDGFTTNDVPWKFEAGTPPIAEAVGLTAAIEYLSALGMTEVREHERSLTAYALDALGARHPELIVHGPADAFSRGGVISFQYKRRPPPRSVTGPRPSLRFVCARRSPLRQAPDAPPRSGRDGPGFVLGVQRRG